MYWSYPILPFGIVACTFFRHFVEIAVYRRVAVLCECRQTKTGVRTCVFIYFFICSGKKMFKYFGIVQCWQLRLKVGSYFGSLPFLKLNITRLSRRQSCDTFTVVDYHVLIKTPFPLWVSKSGHKAVHFWDCWRSRPKYIENTFKAIQRTFRALEKHSRRRCKICICSVTLGELQSFGNYKGLIIIFLDEICCITEVRHFLIPLSIKFLNPKILGSFFLRKIA